MTDQAITSILQQYGSLGLLVAVAGYALRFLHNQLVESLEKRVSDAQAFATRLLALADEQHKQIDTLARAIDGSSDANHELRVLIEQALADRLPRGPSAPRRAGA